MRPILALGLFLLFGMPALAEDKPASPATSPEVKTEQKQEEIAAASKSAPAAAATPESKDKGAPASPPTSTTPEKK